VVKTFIFLILSFGSFYFEKLVLAKRCLSNLCQHAQRSAAPAPRSRSRRSRRVHCTQSLLLVRECQEKRGSLSKDAARHLQCH
jgi:hypothetical protein